MSPPIIWQVTVLVVSPCRYVLFFIEKWYLDSIACMKRTNLDWLLFTLQWLLTFRIWTLWRHWFKVLLSSKEAFSWYYIPILFMILTCNKSWYLKLIKELVRLSSSYTSLWFKASVCSCLQVSHDEHLISGSVEELWVVSEGKIAPFDGTFQDYKKILQSH